MKKKICLTFDVEDWFQVENLRSAFPPETWDNQELRVEKNTKQILDLLDKYNIKATFFVLGWIAEKVPDLVKDIYRRGHEIASHGYSHILNYKMSEEEMRKDLKKSKELLESIINDEVRGYRAPSFSIKDELMFILKNLGYKYDSSLNSFALHDRYGMLIGKITNKPFIHQSGIIEFPMPVISIMRANVPISGGGYFRIYPLWFFKQLVQMYLKKNDVYIFYMHPWEIDEGQPRVKEIKTFYYFRHYYGLNKTFDKLERFIRLILKEVDFTTLANFVELTKTSFNI